MIGDDRLAKLEELEAVVITGRFGRVRGSFLAWVAVGASIRSTNQVVSSVMCRQVSSAGECTDDDRHDLPAPALGRLLFGRQQPSASPGETTVTGETTHTISRIRDVEAPLSIGH